VIRKENRWVAIIVGAKGSLAEEVFDTLSKAGMGSSDGNAAVGIALKPSEVNTLNLQWRLSFKPFFDP